MVFACLISPLQAQNLPLNIPDPSHLEEQFIDKSLPRSGTTILLPEAADDLTPSESGIRFILNEVKVSGVTVFDAEDLIPLYQEYQGQEISIGQVFELARKMTAFYRNNGYILSQVVVPVQSIEDGNLMLTAVEGFIDQVFIEGDPPANEDSILQLANKIKASRPLKAKDLERYILLINDFPGVSARAVLRASNTRGATNLSIVVEQERASQFYAADNRGSKFNGPVLAQMGFGVNSVLGDATKTGFRAIASLQDSEFRFLELNHQLPVGQEGSIFWLSLRNTLSKPGDSLEPLEIESKSNLALLSFRKPVLRSRARNLFLRSSLDIRNTRTNILGTAFTEDKVRALRLAAEFDFIDDLNGINLIDIELSRGLDIFDSSDASDTQSGNRSTSRADAVTEFYKLNGSFQRLQGVTPAVSVLFGATGQYTEDGLFASEEMALGGVNYGRVFDPAELTGERGIAGRLELRRDGRLQFDFINHYQAFLYTDYGTIWDRQEDGDYRSESLGSAGGGIRLGLTSRYSAYVEISVPTNSTAEHKDKWGNSPRGFFGINVKL